MPKSKKGSKAIGHKIAKLRGEGYEQDQAVAIGLSMAREGKLGRAAKSKAPPRKRAPRQKKHYRE